MIEIDAQAKINLGLEVLFKRADNFHEINTIFYKTCLRDKLVIQEWHELEVECLPDYNIPQEENLAYKAAKLLSKKYNIKKGAKITIHKNIPMGGGLGGGSSNAGAALKGLAKLWELKTDVKSLTELAAELGSDVPFFIGEKNAANGKGRGEELEYFDLEMPYALLLINPGIHISTPGAYKALKRGSERVTGSDLKGKFKGNINKPEELRKWIRNDFEEPAFKEHPVLKDIKEGLYKEKAAFVLMSGSGSTIFALFVNNFDAENALSKFSEYYTHLCYKK